MANVLADLGWFVDTDKPAWGRAEKDIMITKGAEKMITEAASKKRCSESENWSGWKGKL